MAEELRHAFTIIGSTPCGIGGSCIYMAQSLLGSNLLEELGLALQLVSLLVGLGPRVVNTGGYETPLQHRVPPPTQCHSSIV